MVNEKSKEEKANYVFKELTNNININERIYINNAWTIPKIAVSEASSKSLKKKLIVAIVPRKE